MAAYHFVGLMFFVNSFRYGNETSKRNRGSRGSRDSRSVAMVEAVGAEGLEASGHKPSCVFETPNETNTAFSRS